MKITPQTLTAEQRKAVNQHKSWLEDEIRRREIATQKIRDIQIEKETQCLQKRLQDLCLNERGAEMKYEVETEDYISRWEIGDRRKKALMRTEDSLLQMRACDLIDRIEVVLGYDEAEKLAELIKNYASKIHAKTE